MRKDYVCEVIITRLLKEGRMKNARDIVFYAPKWWTPRHMHRYTLNVLRFGRDGKLKESHPCLECIKMLKKWYVRKIRYSTVEEGLEPTIITKKINQLTKSHVSRGHRLRFHF